MTPDRRFPNWLIEGQMLTWWCPRCGRWLARTTAIIPGAELYLVCKSCKREVRLVTPEGVSEAVTIAA